MTLYKNRTFSVPATTPTKRPCTVHHMVKGQCLRCDHKVTKITDDKHLAPKQNGTGS